MDELKQINAARPSPWNGDGPIMTGLEELALRYLMIWHCQLKNRYPGKGDALCKRIERSNIPAAMALKAVTDKDVPWKSSPWKREVIVLFPNESS